MGITILKVLLVVFLVVGVGVLLVTFIRRSRASGFPTPESSTHFGQLKGAMPPLPAPPWTPPGGEDRDDPGEHLGGRRRT